MERVFVQSCSQAQTFLCNKAVAPISRCEQAKLWFGKEEVDGGYDRIMKGTSRAADIVE